MARLVGVFQDCNTVDAVVEQLQFNGITQTTIIAPNVAPEDATAWRQQFQTFGVPDKQIAEYEARLAAHRWLLLIEASALQVPMVQRALRAGQAADIDLLPDSI